MPISFLRQALAKSRSLRGCLQEEVSDEVSKNSDKDLSDQAREALKAAQEAFVAGEGHPYPDTPGDEHTDIAIRVTEVFKILEGPNPTAIDGSARSAQMHLAWEIVSASQPSGLLGHGGLGGWRVASVTPAVEIHGKAKRK
jgi:hypothetical protein